MWTPSPPSPPAASASCACSPTSIPHGEPRQWRVGEPFEDHARRFLPRARRTLPGEAWLLERLRHHPKPPHRLRRPDAGPARRGQARRRLPGRKVRVATSPSPPRRAGSSSPTASSTPPSAAATRWSRPSTCRSRRWLTEGLAAQGAGAVDRQAADLADDFSATRRRSPDLHALVRRQVEALRRA